MPDARAVNSSAHGHAVSERIQPSISAVPCVSSRRVPSGGMRLASSACMRSEITLEAPHVRARVREKHVPVAGKIRVKRDPEQPCFVGRRVDPPGDVHEGRRHRAHPVVAHAAHAADLLEEVPVAVVPRRLHHGGDRREVGLHREGAVGADARGARWSGKRHATRIRGSSIETEHRDRYVRRGVGRRVRGDVGDGRVRTAVVVGDGRVAGDVARDGVGSRAVRGGVIGGRGLRAGATRATNSFCA